MTTMPKLSDAQRVLLSQASQHESGLATLPKIPRIAAENLIRSLLGRELLTEVPAPQEHAAIAWRQDEDGTGFALRITDAGLRAIGVEPEENTADYQLPIDGQSIAEGGAPVEPTSAQDEAPQDQDAPAPEAAQGAPVPQDEATRPAVERMPRSLRDAARRVLVAWDDEANQRDDLADAMDALRISIAGKPARGPAQRRPRREGTKLMTVLALLKRPEGANVAQVCEATGWTKDTVRGFFVGLKKKGISVEAVEKVRSVGPNRAGGRGSYTIYRVAEAGEA